MRYQAEPPHSFELKYEEVPEGELGRYILEPIFWTSLDNVEPDEL